MSLRYVLMDLSLFENEAERPSSQKRILALLEALTLINQFYLEEHPDTPSLYQLVKEGKVTYKLPQQMDEDNKGFNGEQFRDIGRIIENGGGDCDNLACMRAAEYRFRLGIAAQPYITHRFEPDGKSVYHVVVLLPDGSSEDPCLLAHMDDRRTEDIANEQRKLVERAQELVAGQLVRRRAPDVFEGLESERRAKLLSVMGLLLRGAG